MKLVRRTKPFEWLQRVPQHRLGHATKRAATQHHTLASGGGGGGGGGGAFFGKVHAAPVGVQSFVFLNLFQRDRGFFRSVLADFGHKTRHRFLFLLCPLRV